MARRRARYTMLGAEEDINVTSLLDVIMNLLFFFLLGTQLKEKQDALKVALPESSQGAPTVVEAANPRVSVARDGSMTLDDAPVTPEQLTAQLQAKVAAGQQVQVMLSADGQATVQMSIDAMDAIRRAGIQEVMQQVDRASTTTKTPGGNP